MDEDMLRMFVGMYIGPTRIFNMHNIRAYRVGLQKVIIHSVGTFGYAIERNNCKKLSLR